MCKIKSILLRLAQCATSPGSIKVEIDANLDVKLASKIDHQLECGLTSWISHDFSIQRCKMGLNTKKCSYPLKPQKNAQTLKKPSGTAENVSNQGFARKKCYSTMESPGRGKAIFSEEKTCFSITEGKTWFLEKDLTCKCVGS